MRLPFFLASGFVASETMEGTLPVLRGLRSEGLHTTVDLLGEYVMDRGLAEEGRDTYIRLLRSLAEDKEADVNISIKLSMIGQMIDEDFCLENLQLLLAAARETRGFIRLDMEGTTVLESTLRLFDAAYPEYGDHVGIVLQAYLKRTRTDVERMCDLGARVRLCKGAYKEPPELAYQNMKDIRKLYIENMKLLLTRGNYPAIATHDNRLIEATKAFAWAESIPNDRFEFQMLYQIRPQTQRDICRDGYNMRVYVPFGRNWLPYYSRRLRERKENVFFLLRNLLRR